MKIKCIIAFLFLSFSVSAHAIVLDEMIQTLNTPQQEEIVRPQTTAELRELFSVADDRHVPRIFVDKLPNDFAENGDEKLYAQVLGALILRENEKALKDKIIANLLKKKRDEKEEWTESENAFFNLLVNKYDVIAKKNIDTQLDQLLLKADEVPLGMAIAQSVYDTDWGKKQMDAPYGQTGWLDEKRYENIKFDSLIKATESYVNEMNSTPNYYMWRVQRQRAAHRGSNRRHSFNFAAALRVYRPEDPAYPSAIRALILKKPFLSKIDNLTFIDEDKAE